MPGIATGGRTPSEPRQTGTGLSGRDFDGSGAVVARPAHGRHRFLPLGTEPGAVTRRVRRRRFLAALGATGLAGCSGRQSVPRAPRSTAESTGRGPSSGGDGTPTANGTLAERGWPPDICELDPVDIGLRPLVDPEPAEEWPGVTVGEDFALHVDGAPDEDVVVGVARDGRARAYPLATLWWHEVVNDDLGGPILVTYCPLCRTGVVADRHVAGEVATFAPSGRVWRPPEDVVPQGTGDDGALLNGTLDDSTAEALADRRNLVMIDDVSDSYWSQLLAKAICGPRRGERLSLLPATMTTWGEWTDRYPETTVVLPPGIDPDGGSSAEGGRMES